MKVVAFNSSARADRESKTGVMLDPLVAGMREAGAEVKVFNLKDYKIKYCLGCFTCWTKTPGVCVIKDDMTKELYPAWLEADLVVLATPLYHFTVNAALKTLIERTLPTLEPFFEVHDGHTHHPMRHPWPATVVLSVAGFPMMSVFDELSRYINYLIPGEGTLWAEIYRPGAESMVNDSRLLKDILDATRQAGRELIETRAISPETMARVTQDVVSDIEDFAALGNCFWQSCVDRGITPREFDEAKKPPRPNSIRAYNIIMKAGFNAEGAGDTTCTIQFNFSGEVTDGCYFHIHDGVLDTFLGSAENPDLVINAPFGVWMDIITGKLDGQQAFMEQKYTVSGDFNILMNFGKLFGA